MMGRRRRCRQGTRSRCGDGRRRGRGRAVAVAVAADGEDDDDEPLAGPAPRRVGADEVVGPGVVEHEAGVAAVEPLGWLRGVAGVVVALAHQQHGVRVLAVPEHCMHAHEDRTARERNVSKQVSRMHTDRHTQHKRVVGRHVRRSRTPRDTTRQRHTERKTTHRGCR